MINLENLKNEGMKCEKTEVLRCVRKGTGGSRSATKNSHGEEEEFFLVGKGFTSHYESRRIPAMR